MHTNVNHFNIFSCGMKFNIQLSVPLGLIKYIYYLQFNQERLNGVLIFHFYQFTMTFLWRCVMSVQLELLGRCHR